MTNDGSPRILVNALSVVAGGGSRSYVVNLLRELERDPRGLRFTFLVSGSELVDASFRNVAFRQLALPEKPAALRLALRLAYEQGILPWVAGGYDALYCIADVAPSIARVPTVVALRNMNIYDRRWYDNRRTRTLARLARAGARSATRCVFPSRAAAELIAPGLGVPEERISVVHHGVSDEAFRGDAEPRRADVPYLLLPAAVEPHKNIEVLAEAIRYLDDPALEVWVAGSYESDPRHAARVFALVERLGVGKRLRFLGPVPYADMIAYYRGARALVVPSFIETFGHPLLEAMLAGTPIVASDIPTFREVAADVALYFPPDDPRALARAVGRVTTDADATRERIARGSRRAAEFSWSRSVDRLAQVLREAAAEAA
jgi:glycosyltransferase involved in cell wall biosynthesis